MPSVTRVQEAAEAVCGALIELGWEFMGETNQRASTWFIRGDKPKQTRIEVQRSRLADYLIVNIEWPALSNPPHPGRLTININIGDSTHRQVKDATERAVVRCLEVMRDVAGGIGLADPKHATKAPDIEETEEGAGRG
jgi:hypothetical protein